MGKMSLLLIKHGLQVGCMSHAYSHDSAICFSGVLEVNKAKVMCQIRKRRREVGVVGIRYHTMNIRRVNATMLNSEEA
jgi:hypothetical protein